MRLNHTEKGGEYHGKYLYAGAANAITATTATAKASATTTTAKAITAAPWK